MNGSTLLVLDYVQKSKGGSGNENGVRVTEKDQLVIYIKFLPFQVNVLSRRTDFVLLITITDP